jgi:hypothetical protein
VARGRSPDSVGTAEQTTLQSLTVCEAVQDSDEEDGEDYEDSPAVEDGVGSFGVSGCLRLSEVS